MISWFLQVANRLVYFVAGCLASLASTEYFPDTQVRADQAVCDHQLTQVDMGAEDDPHAAWSFSDIMHAAEARLMALDD